jgi:hypothetical protein
MLNGTLCATERALCCLVENYQTPEVSTDDFEQDCPDTLLVGPTNPRATPTIHARPRLSSLGERTTEEFATETGLRMRCVLASAYLEVQLSMYVPQLGRSRRDVRSGQEIFEIPLSCQIRKKIVTESVTLHHYAAERKLSAARLPEDIILSEEGRELSPFGTIVV